MKRLLSLLLLALALCACSTDNEYSKYSCYFVLDNSKHQSTVLMACMNSMSTGMFCRITESGSNPVRFKFESNQGGEAEYKTANAEDLKRTRILGVYNGVIVGYGNLSSPATFYAYDNQCRNCYEETGLVRYALTMNVDGTVTCKTCKRSYDLNNGGVVTSGKSGKNLIRYRASTTGPLGVLAVGN